MDKTNLPADEKILKVLLLDDVEGEFIFLKQAFKSIGFPAEVSHLMDPTKLVDTLRANKYDVLFLDLAMPILSGLECVVILRQHPEFDNLQIVIMTGAEQPEDKQTSADLGVKMFYNKPSTAEGMAEMLRSLIPELTNFKNRWVRAHKPK